MSRYDENALHTSATNNIETMQNLFILNERRRKLIVANVQRRLSEREKERRADRERKISLVDSAVCRVWNKFDFATFSLNIRSIIDV